MPAARQILTAAQMRDAEAALIAAGDTIETLMERAGRGAADYVFRMAAGRAVTVLCGPGNNGGDGYVIARVLAERGVKVQVVAPIAPKTDAARAARAFWGGQPVEHATGHVFVDCLFGTGITRSLDREMANLLRELASAHALRIAVDLPSGVDADTGEGMVYGMPEYHLTLALGAWKWAHWILVERLGARRLVNIGVGAVEGAGQVAARARLFAPHAVAHKYSRGLLGVVRGEMPGASLLAARAASHGGAGYVKLLGKADASTPPDLVTDSRPLAEVLEDVRVKALLLGPGLGLEGDGDYRLRECLGLCRQLHVPLVLDADALRLLGMQQHLVGDLPELILTPHAGELGRLFEAFEVWELADLARLLDAVVVSKGPVTMIASRDGSIEVMPQASSWLSTAGTGDVLAGLIASRLATGILPEQAASEGCQLHAEAARLAGPAFSAGNLIDYIPAAYANFL